jgi:hypothetical protein
MFSLFKEIKPDVLPAGTPLINRLINRINYYLTHEVRIILGRTGRNRAEALRHALLSLPDADKADDILTKRMFAYLGSPFGESKSLGNSLTLRFRLLDALAEHLDIPVDEVRIAITASLVGVDARAATSSTYGNREINAGCNVLYMKSALCRAATNIDKDFMEEEVLSAKSSLAQEGRNISVMRTLK